MSKDLKQLVRPNILKLAPYSSARNEYSGHRAHVFLDANENPYNKPYNRYPDPLQKTLKEEISKVKGVKPENIFLGNGSDEAIDLCYRVFCEPGLDNVVAIEPTYGMYKVCADINNVAYRAIKLNEHFELIPEKILAACNGHTKLVWLCSPNNPTGNLLSHNGIRKILKDFEGIVIVDEAYSDFSLSPTFREELENWGNLIVLNTFSKAWGCAALRLGMAYAQPAIIDLFNKVKYPYNINLLTQEKAMDALKHRYDVNDWVKLLLQERANTMNAVQQLPFCKEVYPSDANFFLARMTDATAIYNYLINKGIVVRNRTNVQLCDNCLRITIGSKSENTELIAALRKY